MSDLPEGARRNAGGAVAIGGDVTIRVVNPLPKKGRRLPLVVRFGLQVVTGAAIFAIIAAAASALSYGTHLMEELHVPPIIVTGVRGVELLIFAGDIISMTVFVVVETITLVREMISGLRSGHD